MTTHVFIVTDDTFQTHLNYMFAGTGAGEDGRENIGMISDISGCRKGDKVIFYLTQNTKENRDGKFFGIFEIASTPFWQKDGDYLYDKNKLNKRLTNRVLIKPYKVYAKGVSEWDALDNLDKLPRGKNSRVNELIWSLIYRKLQGNRGCTPIFDYEYEQILNLIKHENDDVVLSITSNYQFNGGEISDLNNGIKYDVNKITNKDLIPLQDYQGKVYTVEEKIIKVVKEQFKYKRGKGICTQHKCEAELEYFFVSKTGVDERIDKIIGNSKELDFWGSQIFFGVGKRRIDIMTLSKDKELRLIELKDEQFEEYQLEQISKYVKWAQQYIREPHNSIIQPILVVNDFSSDDVPSLRDFNSGHKNCKKIKIFTWNTKGNKINFEEFNYND